MIKYNPEQQTAVALMGDTLISTDQKGLTLIGEGGTGKTTCVAGAVEKWVKAGLNVLLTAPTNKATNQLAKSIRSQGITSSRVGYATLARALGMTMLPVDERKKASRVSEGLINDYDILVLDEGSMVAGHVWYRYLLPDVESSPIKMVVMGDAMQLPPVREKESVALQHFPVTELVKVERFTEGSAIAQVTTAMREAIKSDRIFFFDSKDYQVEVVKPAFFMKKILEEFKTAENTSDLQVIAWTNKRVDFINEQVREVLYGKDAEQFNVGERVVTGGPIRQYEEICLSTDEECIVTDVQVSSIMDESTGEEYKTHMVTLEPLYADVKTVYCHVIHPDDELKLQEKLAEIARRANSSARPVWAEWHKLNDLFASLKYTYCLTVHRSQGSSYKRVFVDVDNILRCKTKSERDKLLYVAASRAQESLVFNREKFTS